MKISLNWLKEYIDITVSPEKLSEILTDLGLEVEGMEKLEGVKGGLEGVIVGHIIECGKHPNADRLALTKVDLGGGDSVQIVCGAPNVAAGQKVLVATTGCTLYPIDGEPIKIKKGKIRGEVSEGMICAEDELGLGTDHDGIMVLDEDAIAGTPAKQQLKLKDDIIYDIGLTPNRSDATSHIGVVKDLLAYFRVHGIESSQVRVPDVYQFSVDSNQHNHVTVEIEDVVGCPRFSGVALSGIHVGESPDWMKQRLQAIGVRPVNNIVDITNYVLHEIGQPLHAYDLDQIKASKIIVKCLPEGTKFKTLDDKVRTLRASDLMVCSGLGEGMCIAGVFGGAESGVVQHTKNIFLEAAHFNAKQLRVTSTKHLLRTDAAMRFEKGTDPNQTLYALKRAALLMKDYASAQISSDIIDVYPKEIQPAKITVKYEKLNKLIGINMKKEDISTILDALDIEIEATNHESFTVKIPTNKADVTRDADVIEEILRVYGFNNIPISDVLKTSITFEKYPTRLQVMDTLAGLLTGKGYHEMMNLSLIQSSQYAEQLPSYMEQLVYINNTSNIHLDVMRPEMLLPALQVIAYNHNRQNKNLKYFEIGRDYQQSGDEIYETNKLILISTGAAAAQNWNQVDQQADFYSLRRMVDELLIKAGAKSYKINELSDNRFAYGLSYARGKDHIVSFGRVNQKLASGLGISEEVYYAEFAADMLHTLASQAITKIDSINKYPTVRRDLALIIDESKTFQEIEMIVKKADKKLIKEVGLFDIYKNDEQLGTGKKSYAISIIFEDQTKTLQDKQIDKIMTKMITLLKSEGQADIR